MKPYKVNEVMVNQELELKHGDSTRRFAMDKVSNAPFDQVRLLNARNPPRLDLASVEGI